MRSFSLLLICAGAVALTVWMAEGRKAATSQHAQLPAANPVESWLPAANSRDVPPALRVQMETDPDW